MASFDSDSFSINKASSNFEDEERFCNFLIRLEKLELKKVSRSIITNYTNKNWVSLSKDCNFLKDLSNFLQHYTLTILCKNFRNHLKQKNPNSKLTNEYVYEILLQLENLTMSIKSHLGSCLDFKKTYQKEDFELFSFDSTRKKELTIIKTTPPSCQESHF